jgi:hypothetical protein
LLNTTESQAIGNDPQIAPMNTDFCRPDVGRDAAGGEAGLSNRRPAYDISPMITTNPARINNPVPRIR